MKPCIVFLGWLLLRLSTVQAAPNTTVPYQSSKTLISRSNTSSAVWKAEESTSGNYSRFRDDDQALIIVASPSRYSSLNTNDTGLGPLNLVAPPVDQGACGTCVAAVVTGAAETAIAATMRIDVKNCSLSMFSLQFCSPKTVAACRSGWTFSSALEELMARQLPTAACVPYDTEALQSDDADAIKTKCSQCKAVNPILTQGRFSAIAITGIASAQKHIRRYGSVVTRFDVYSDLKTYFASNSSAIYKPGKGAKWDFAHAVELVGYDNEGEYWLAKNSWGTGWADGGFSGILESEPPGGYGVVWNPANIPTTSLLPVTPSNQTGCYYYEARIGDYPSKVAWMAGMSLRGFILLNKNQSKESPAVLPAGKNFVMCGADPGRIQVIGGAPKQKPACPDIYGFTILHNKAVKHKRIFQAIGVTDIALLIKECQKTPTCAAVDTSGWLRFDVTTNMPETELELLSASIDGCAATYIISDPSKTASLRAIGTLWSGLFLSGGNPLRASVKANTQQYMAAVAQAVTKVRTRYKKSRLPTLLGSYDTETTGFTADQIALMSALPPRWDSRNKTDTGGRNYVQPARDQQSCGSCVAFAVVAAAETAVAVARNIDVKDVAFSEQGLWFCPSGQMMRTCKTGQGWYIDQAMQALTTDGLWTADCLPYSIPRVGFTKSNNMCERKCDTKAPGDFSQIPVDDIFGVKEAITEYGSVVTAMVLYPDVYGMPYRPEEVYQTIPDIPKDREYVMHAVVLVGYNDIDNYWLVKSSWGPDWPSKGKGGVFKVKYGEAVVVDVPSFTGTTFAVSWQGPGSKQRVLAPLVPDKSRPGCTWYTAKPGDTLVAIWKASVVRSMSKLIDDNGQVPGGDDILQPPMSGKKVLLCQ